MKIYKYCSWIHKNISGHSENELIRCVTEVKMLLKRLSFEFIFSSKKTSIDGCKVKWNSETCQNFLQISRRAVVDIFELIFRAFNKRQLIRFWTFGDFWAIIFHKLWNNFKPGMGIRAAKHSPIWTSSKSCYNQWKYNYEAT